VSVVLMDLDRFKDVNDTLGHDVGDELLAKVGARLARVAPGNESLARLGGDEFAALVPGGRDEAEEFARRALSEFGQPFQVEGLAVEVAPSIGIASYPSDGEIGQVVLSRADIAMYKAKKATSRIEVYSTDIDHYSPDRLVLAGELRRAIEEGQLLLHYQPKVDLGTEAIIGVEALVRWEHPARGLVQPDQFIPLAESSGLIRPLTTWVLTEALAHCRRGSDGGIRIPVAVNISARSLLDDHLAEEVSDLLSANGVDPSLLILEVTESSMVEEGSHVEASLHALRDMGISLAIDDFGTGYSSLAYLQRLPVQELKIDRSFVMRLGEDNGGVPIVRAAVDLGKALDLIVVAEGVESEVAAAILRNVGCPFGQGYYFGRPMSEENLVTWLRTPRPGKLDAAG
jgi:diguanylate cyclase